MPAGDAYTSGHLVPSLWDLHLFYLLRPILFGTCRHFTDYALLISLGTLLAYDSHASMIISKFWCHENETSSLNVDIALLNEQESTKVDSDGPLNSIKSVIYTKIRATVLGLELASRQVEHSLLWSISLYIFDILFLSPYMLCNNVYVLPASVGCWSSAFIRRIFYKCSNVCPFDYTAFAVSGKVGIP